MGPRRYCMSPLYTVLGTEGILLWQQSEISKYGPPLLFTGSKQDDDYVNSFTLISTSLANQVNFISFIKELIFRI